MHLLLLALVGGASALNVHRLDVRAAESACSPVHIIVGRASTESQSMSNGEGIIKSLADTIVKQNAGTTVESVIYPAELAPYAPSSSKGTAAVIKQTTAYVQRCPDAKIVLMGYSQASSPTCLTSLAATLPSLILYLGCSHRW